MNNRRTEKVAQAVRECVSNSILFNVKDPRVKNVTVLDVEMSPDLQAAKITISIMGDEKEQKLCLHGLNSARGFLQSQIADHLQMRYTPILSFVQKSADDQSLKTAEILDEVRAELAEHDHDQDNEEADNEEAEIEKTDVEEPTEQLASKPTPGRFEDHPQVE